MQLSMVYEFSIVLVDKRSLVLSRNLTIMIALIYSRLFWAIES